MKRVLCIAVITAFLISLGALAPVQTTQQANAKAANANLIINGDFSVWQRGEIFDNPVGFERTADRWVWGGNAATAWRISRSDDSPTRLTQDSIEMRVTGIMGANFDEEGSHLRYAFESKDAIPLASKLLTYSFWTKSNRPGTYAVAIVNPVANRTLLKEYTVSQSDHWERQVLAFQLEDANYGQGEMQGLKLRFSLNAGQPWRIDPDVWTSGNFVGSTHQDNLSREAGDYMRIGQVQLEIGPETGGYSVMPQVLTLARCKRYYRVISRDSSNSIEYMRKNAFVSIAAKATVDWHEVPKERLLQEMQRGIAANESRQGRTQSRLALGNSELKKLTLQAINITNHDVTVDAEL